MDAGLLFLILFFPLFALLILWAAISNKRLERARRRTIENHVATLGGSLVEISDVTDYTGISLDDYESSCDTRYAYKYVDQSGQAHEGLCIFSIDRYFKHEVARFYEDEAMADAD